MTKTHAQCIDLFLALFSWTLKLRFCYSWFFTIVPSGGITTEEPVLIRMRKFVKNKIYHYVTVFKKLHFVSSKICIVL